MKRLLIAIGLLVGLAAPASAQAPCYVRINGVSYGCVFSGATISNPVFTGTASFNASTGTTGSVLTGGSPAAWSATPSLTSVLFPAAGSTALTAFSTNGWQLLSNDGGSYVRGINGQLQINSAVLTFGSGGTIDTGISRTGAAAFSFGTATQGNATGTLGYASAALSGKNTTYNNVVTAGLGHPAIYGYGDVAAATNTGTASIASYANGATDGTFQVGCNILVTTSTTHSFSCDVTYTDESNAARTMVLPVVQLAGTFVTTGLITNVTGAGPYESPVMTIRAKASTTITVRTSAGGTFTTVVYNARGYIAQVSN